MRSQQSGLSGGTTQLRELKPTLTLPKGGDSNCLRGEKLFNPPSLWEGWGKLLLTIPNPHHGFHTMAGLAY